MMDNFVFSLMNIRECQHLTWILMQLCRLMLADRKNTRKTNYWLISNLSAVWEYDIKFNGKVNLFLCHFQNSAFLQLSLQNRNKWLHMAAPLISFVLPLLLPTNWCDWFLGMLCMTQWQSVFEVPSHGIDSLWYVLIVKEHHGHIHKVRYLFSMVIWLVLLQYKKSAAAASDSALQCPPPHTLSSEEDS